MIVMDKAGREVDVGGERWVFYSAHERFTIDWTTVAELPAFIITAAKAYATKLLKSGAPSSVRDFVRGSIRPLLRCPSVQPGTTALDERTFDDLRRIIAHDKASLQRFRRFYRYSYNARLDGFDRASVRVMSSIKVGQHRAPSPLLGRNPPLQPDQSDFLLRGLEAYRDLLPLDGRVAVGLSLALGPNADPMALSRGDDLIEAEDGPKFGVVQHKKRHVHERFELRGLPIGVRLAEDIWALNERNFDRAATMAWPDGTIGLPAGVEVPLFMRRTPKPSHADRHCPVREYALHMTPTEISELIRDTVASICAHAGVETIHMTARTGRRTTFTEAQRAGLSPAAMAFIGGHRSLNHIGNYAAEGLGVLEHVERALGDRISEICAAFVSVAPALADGTQEIVLELRKATLGPIFRRNDA